VLSHARPQIPDARRIVNHLAACGLIDLEDVVRGDLILIEVPRRNRNLKVVVRQGPCYFIKEAVDLSSRLSVIHEASFYQLVSCYPCSNGLQKFLPRYYNFDSDAHLLVLELVRASRDLWEHYKRAGRSSILLARQTGRALAELHKLTASDQARALLGTSFAADPPWVLSLYHPSLSVLRQISSANLKLVKTIQHYAGFGESLRRLSLEWRQDRLIHFDIKSENLVAVPGPSGQWTRLALVDWEFVGLGDPCWDIGSVFADYLGRWLITLSERQLNTPEQLHDPNSSHLAKMQVILRTFWKEYVWQMQLKKEADWWLVRSVEYAAARLLQRCYEQLQLSTDLTFSSILMMQVSQNLLQRPTEAAVQLLGLPFDYQRHE
jgi:thiamine kinase-like enzyme